MMPVLRRATPMDYGAALRADVVDTQRRIGAGTIAVMILSYARPGR